MPSPDVADYLGLELIPGVTAEQLLATALANMAISFPDWTPREGNTEVVVLEEVAAIVEELVYAVRQLPDGLTEVLLRLFGQSRDPGEPPNVNLYIELGEDYAQDVNTIPAGTVFEVTAGDGTTVVNFTTIEDYSNPPGSPFMYVTAYAGDPTTIINGAAAANGATVTVIDALEFIEVVYIDDLASGGRDPEDGAAFLDRTIPTLARLTTTLVRPADITAYVSALADVVRVKVLDLYSPTDSRPVGTALGYVTVVVAGAAGSALSSPRRTAIRNDLADRMHAGLTVAVVSPNLSTIDVTINVLAYPGASSPAVTAAVTDAIGTYIDPDVWPWINTVRVNEIIAAADKAAGVDTVLGVSQHVNGSPALPTSADLAIAGVAPLAKLGTVTVTVIEGA